MNRAAHADAAARRLVLAAAELVRGVPTIESLAAAILYTSTALVELRKADPTGKAFEIAIGQVERQQLERQRPPAAAAQDPVG